MSARFASKYGKQLSRTLKKETSNTKRSEAKPLEDNRPGSAVQRKQAEIMSSYQADKPIQKKTNKTGLPDQLKSGIENLSGHSMDDVRVHYNSGKPAQLNAHAYAQGNDIHLASGQEKHLPHEAWHVVQQKQGRVKPTLQMKSKVLINDDKELEKEADIMGARALQLKSTNSNNLKEEIPSLHGLKTVQRSKIGFPVKGKVEDEIAFQLKRKPSVVQRIEINTGTKEYRILNTEDGRRAGDVLSYFKYLYTRGEHGRLAELYHELQAEHGSQSAHWMDILNGMMQHRGLNRLVANVAGRSGEQNFAQGYVRIFNTKGQIIAAHETDATGSGEEMEAKKSVIKPKGAWETAKSSSQLTTERRDRQVSSRDAEAIVCDKLLGEFHEKIEDKIGYIEIHLVTYNGPCDACKTRVSQLALALKQRYDQGRHLPVYVRVYYIKPPKDKERGRRDTATTYGWHGDATDERGLFTHDDRV